MVIGPINLSSVRLWVGVGTVLTCGLVVAWVFSPGLPVIIGPWALELTKVAGREIFEHEWEPNDLLAGGDGVGPVYNAKSCVACHNQGGVGGSGDNSHNVRVFEVMPTPGSPDVKSGVVHAYATESSLQENETLVHKLYPVLKGSTIPAPPGCGLPTTIPDFDPVVFEEVNTTSLFGAGWIDCISEKAIVSNRTRRLAASAGKELGGDFSDVPVGRLRRLPDGRVGKFGWKAQSATLEDFVATACSNELGLGTPSKEQARPVHRPDYPSAAPDLTRKQFKNLVGFVSTLPRPVEVAPSDPAAHSEAARGKQLFNTIGCAACHTPDLNGVKGVYSDFLLYTLEDQRGDGGGGYGGGPLRELPLPEDHPRPNEWKTPPLWGLADSAPYFHDGKSPTLRDAILRHRGDAKSVTERYKGLDEKDQAALIAFLMTLKAPKDAAQVAKK
jgi:CxxC motif-containing protein (DUF1111 family)